MQSRADLLARFMADAFDGCRRRLEGLTDDEFFWEPAPDCWTVYRDRAGRWTYHYELPDPEPAPFTTIGWRLMHIATCKVMYHEYAFGPAELTWDAIETPHDAEGGLRMLDEGQRLLVSDLASVPENSLDEPRATNWGESWPAWRIFFEMAQHDLHHGAEIGVLRDLYRTLAGGLPDGPG